jgi:hypothetical protein
MRSASVQRLSEIGSPARSSRHFPLGRAAVAYRSAVTYQLYAYRVFAGKVREGIFTYGAPAAVPAIQARRVQNRTPGMHFS